MNGTHSVPGEAPSPALCPPPLQGFNIIKSEVSEGFKLNVWGHWGPENHSARRCVGPRRAPEQEVVLPATPTRTRQIDN